MHDVPRHCCVSEVKQKRLKAYVCVEETVGCVRAARSLVKNESHADMSEARFKLVHL